MHGNNNLNFIIFIIEVKLYIVIVVCVSLKISSKI